MTQDSQNSSLTKETEEIKGELTIFGKLLIFLISLTLFSIPLYMVASHFIWIRNQYEKLYPDISKKDCRYQQHWEDSRFYLVCPEESLESSKEKNDNWEKEQNENQRLREQKKREYRQQVTERFRSIVGSP
ncbi:hypothetical protein WA1_24020 [Scytonema hofmannii PCC 7110]|uniref:Transmembrane protein n=1 Tax=Scytonema hofmannii PCC 7110 TaxID=128403 RepID=A0A139X7N0_9CYAN|nr:hypothetical protein [Scytonema hofmannii]KYC40711.1 hypothetical protein WA1_24020 [Scytonema hofmannii PCC 7110]